MYATFLNRSCYYFQMVQRITYRRRLSYNTRSNRRKITRTPGGKLVFQYLKKRPSVPKCPLTGLKLKGVTPATNQEKARMSRRQKTVFRCLESTFLDFLVFNNIQGIWRSFEPQGSEGKDREGFSYRGAENSYEGA